MRNPSFQRQMSYLKDGLIALPYLTECDVDLAFWTEGENNKLTVNLI